jgi:hypothetical protein
MKIKTSVGSNSKYVNNVFSKSASFILTYGLSILRVNLSFGKY